MEEVEYINNGDTHKLKHIYKNKNYKLQNVSGYCFVCLEDLQFHNNYHNYLCHNNLYSLCASCFSKYINNTTNCICESKVKDVEILYYCETSFININQIIYKYFYVDILNKYHICKNFSVYHLRKFIKDFSKGNLSDICMVLKSSPEYETAPRMIQISYQNNCILINKLIEGTQDSVMSKILNKLNIIDVLKFIEREKVISIDSIKEEDIIYSEYYNKN